MTGKLRITGGRLVRRQFAVPKEAQKGSVRPTSDRVREALFSALGPLDDDVVIDCFAGSGALGIEALSRGAAQVTFIEKNPRVAAHLKQTLKALDVTSLDVTTQVVIGPAVRALAKMSAGVNVLFADPPYALDVDVALLDAMSGVLVEGGRLILERDQKSPVPTHPQLHLLSDRRYGSTRLLTFARVAAS